MSSARFLWTVLALAAAGVAVSWVGRRETFTWFLEAAPVVVGLPLLALTHRAFPLSRLVLTGLLLHAGVLLLGAHYTYAEVPLGEWARTAFGLARNHYDRVGHVAQGFFPALLVRELLLRRTPLRRGATTFVLVTCVCLAFSAFYELVEWWVAIASEDGDATAFLATQGDPWDTQWDMLLATCGAIAAQLLLARVHDRQLATS